MILISYVQYGILITLWQAIEESSPQVGQFYSWSLRLSSLMKKFIEASEKVHRPLVPLYPDRMSDDEKLDRKEMQKIRTEI